MTPFLDSFIGHGDLQKRLLSDAETGVFPHAILLCGPSGIGKFTLAKKIAGVLLQDPHRVQKNVHPSCRILDALWISGVQEDLEVLARSTSMDQSHRKKADKKTDSIGIDDLQVLTKFLFETTDDPWKVCIIRNIDRLGREAGNSFLKTLEEPPPKTVFLLTTNHVARVLPTVLSRVQVQKMHLVPDSLLKKYVPEGKDTHLFLRLAGGRPGVLKKLGEDPQFFASRLQQEEEIHVFSKGAGIIEALRRAEEWASLSSEEIQEKLSLFLSFWRATLRGSFGDVKRMRESVVMISALQKCSEILRGNVNKRLLLEQFFLAQLQS